MVKNNKALIYIFASFMLVCFLSTGCGSTLSYRVASCPMNKAVCAESDMKEIRVHEGLLGVSKTFGFVVTHDKGYRLTSVSATITDNFKNTVAVDSSDIKAPNTHQLVDPTYWLVLFDWSKLSKKGLRVEGGKGRIWTVSINAKWKGDEATVVRQIEVDD